MSNISQIDKNFNIDLNIQKGNIRFFDIRKLPFKIYGVFWEDGKYRRISQTISKNISVGINALHAHTSGGRVRFVTDSRYIAINVEVENVFRASHFTLVGGCGFDMYSGKEYVHTFVPPYEFENRYESVAEFSSSELREITINFPLYGEVNEIYIGLEDGAVLKEASSYINESPIVYYGSSITQGGCSSRPGNAYTHIISINNNKDFINLGFSGSAKGEEIMANYIAGLEMSAFVMDYDHNAPNPEHLEATHEKFFKIIREKNPALPVVFVSKPDFHTAYYRGVSPVDSIRRRDIIYRTYINAVNSGDKFVKFIDGSSLFNGMNSDACTVDGCHPNDLGFMRMAEVIGLSL